MSTPPPNMAALRSAVVAAVVAVKANPDPVAGYHEALDLRAELERLATSARLLRARQVLRMSESGMSMAQIGRALGRHRSRVHQIISQARADIAAAAEAEQQEAA